MIQLALLGTLLRELLRALLTPLRLLCYLPTRKKWRRIASEVLAGIATEEPNDPEQALEAFFAKARPWHGERPHVFLSAGEQSGESHAVLLLTALEGEVRCSAFGGRRLEEAGATLRFALSDHAVMGVIGVLQKLPLLLRAVADYLRLLRDDPPDLVVLVDFPGLHVVMAKLARRRGIPVLHYIAPQYWAWGPWRMRRYRRSVDATLAILPFEAAFFTRFCIPAAYVGNPLLDAMADARERAGEAPRDADDRPLLVLLPGSRSKEIRRNLPGMLRTTAALRAAHPDLRVVLPHHNPARTALLREVLAAHDASFVEHREGPLAPWLDRARLVLAKSGTGSLEACLHGAPTVVVYQLDGLFSTLGYHTILSVPWIAAANLIAGREVVPEFCFHDEAGWDRVTAACRELWPDSPQRSTALKGLAEVQRRLAHGRERGGASERAAAVVRRFLHLAPPGRTAS